MAKTNTSSVEMEDGVKLAFQARTQKNSFGSKENPNEKQVAGERKSSSAAQKAKAKKKAKMAKASRRKNK